MTYFGLRDYGCAQQLGLEASPLEYVTALVAVFRELWRVLKPTGVAFVNLGDSYNGSGKARGNGGNGPSSAKQLTNRGAYFESDVPVCFAGFKAKDLLGIPWRVAFALQADGWYLRADIIWSKPNPMPESVIDRPTKAHEYLFLLAKSERYYYDGDAIREPYSEASLGRYAYSLDGTAPTSRQPQNGDVDRRKREANVRDPNPLGRNKRSVWMVNTESYTGSHFATFPEALVEPCILAGCPVGGVVLDPFVGSGTVGAVAERLGRRWVGVDLAYQDLARERTAQRGLRWEAVGI